MNATFKLLAVTLFLAGAIVISGTAASADSGAVFSNGDLSSPANSELSVAAQDAATNQYRDAMWYFVPELGRWSHELQRTVAAAELKPDVKADLNALAYRGQFLVYDLEGTVPPAEMADVHARLISSVQRLTDAARVASDDAPSASSLINGEFKSFTSSRSEIRAWLMANMAVGNSGSAPVELVTGN